jgi:hypothetical protein
VNISRRDLARPDETLVVVVQLGDGGNGARNPDSVRTHCDNSRLAVLVENREPECLGVLATELEDVADLHTTRDLHCLAAVRARVAVVYLGGLDDAVGCEVATHGEVSYMAAGTVGTGDPSRAVDDARVDNEPDSCRLVLAERSRTDVALGEVLVVGEVVFAERLDLSR